MDLISNKYLSNLATRRCFYMRDVKKILEMRSQNFSQRKIAEALKVSRDTVRKVSKAADKNNICWSMIQNQNEMEVQKLSFGKETKLNLIIKQPDYQYIHKELLRPGTNIRLLWEEYAEDCRNSNFPFYQYSYFCEKYRDYVKKNNLTMHITHKPGDKLIVDWNGTTMCVFDRYTGESIKAYLFEATLPFSMLCYVQACPTMKIADWIDCHINAYSYFEGVTRLLVPDNLKTGVISNKKYEDPVLNKSYQEMADHYDTTIIPARVRKPKALIERFFHTMKMRFMDVHKGSDYHSLSQLNDDLNKWINEYNRTIHSSLKDDENDNHTPLERYMYDMKDVEVSRLSNKSPIEYASWLDDVFLHETTRKVNGDSIVLIENQLFDVPSVYIGIRVIIRYNPRTFEGTYLYDVSQKKKVPLKRTDRIENGKTRREEIIY